jgi:anti-sigma regulatory factor (Ser/Thr protein kinase)
MTRLSLPLPRRADCARIARQWTAEQLGGATDPARLQDLQLLVTELVANAFQHGEGQITLWLERREEGTVRVEVVDEGHGAAVEICRHGVSHPGGQGLRLVDALSTRWGAYEGTTHVWAELAL